MNIKNIVLAGIAAYIVKNLIDLKSQSLAVDKIVGDFMKDQNQVIGDFLAEDSEIIGDFLNENIDSTT